MNDNHANWLDANRMIEALRSRLGNVGLEICAHSPESHKQASGAGQEGCR